MTFWVLSQSESLGKLVTRKSRRWLGDPFGTKPPAYELVIRKLALVRGGEFFECGGDNNRNFSPGKDIFDGGIRAGLVIGTPTPATCLVFPIEI